MTIATCTILPAISRASLVAAAEDAEQAANIAADRYQTALDNGRLLYGWTDDFIGQLERRGTECVPSMTTLSACLADKRKAARAAVMARRTAETTPERPKMLRITITGATDEHRELLRDMGARWSEDALWHDPVGLRTSPGYVLTFCATDPHTPGGFIDAINLLRKAGIRVERE